jgi:hypothetical protein
MHSGIVCALRGDALWNSTAAGGCTFISRCFYVILFSDCSPARHETLFILTEEKTFSIVIR